MAPTDAYLLDNMVPGTASVDSRTGCEKFSTASLGAPVQSMEVYTGATGSKMLAWAGGKMFEVSTGTPNLLVDSLLSSLVVAAMFSNAADNAQHMIIVNGADSPRSYDGTTTTALTMTGVDGSQNTLNYVFAFKGRLYFGQRDKLGFYYLPPGQIQGALEYFDLGQQSKKGGYLVAIGSFSESSTGESPNDYIVFVTSEGEYIVYAGYDPSNADAWQLVGRYFSSSPIGRRCLLNYGTDLLILTLEGLLPFSLIRQAGDDSSSGVAGSGYTALTSKLGDYLLNLNVNADVPGWEGVQYSRAGWLIVNVPATSAISGAYYHYVMNTTTNQWCRFTNWNGLTFCVFNRRLYFGRYDGYIMLADEGRLDDGQPIKCDVKTAYNYFNGNEGATQKHFQWANLIVSCDGEPPISGRFNVDFKEDQPEYVNQLAPSAGAEWDVTAWDEGIWGDDGRTQRFIITLNKGGFAGSLWMRASLQGLTLRWYTTQFVMQPTQGLLI